MLNPPEPPRANLRPKPDWLLLGGAISAIAGYVLPWFQPAKGEHTPPFSGWDYATSYEGGGWTLTTFFWLAAIVIAAGWAGRSGAAAMIGVTATVGAGIFALAVVAAGFAVGFSTVEVNLPVDQVRYVTRPSLDVGLPLLAAGLGLALAAGIRAIVRTTPTTQARHGD